MNAAKGKTILVANSEKITRDELKLHLGMSGYDVLTTENGDEAIKALKAYNISVAITDINLPKVDGLNILNFVKRHCEHIPVIMLTGYGDLKTAIASKKKGSFDYLTKPITRDELIEAVENAIRSNPYDRY